MGKGHCQLNHDFASKSNGNYGYVQTRIFNTAQEAKSGRSAGLRPAADFRQNARIHCSSQFPDLRSELCANATGAGQTPAANGFKNDEQSNYNQCDANPQLEIRHDDAGDEQQGADDTPRDAALKTDITFKKAAHAKHY